MMSVTFGSLVSIIYRTLKQRLTQTDENIMLLVAGGEIPKAAILFERYKIPVYSYLLRLNKNKMLAEDLTQNVFEKVIKYRNSYDNQKCFKAWLFTIVRNTNIDFHRKKKLNIIDKDQVEVNDSSKNIHQQFINEEDKNHLMLAIDKLSTEDKEIILMTKIEKIKYSKVAEITGHTEAAIKVKTHRIIKKLRVILINDMKYEY